MVGLATHASALSLGRCRSFSVVTEHSNWAFAVNSKLRTVPSYSSFAPAHDSDLSVAQNSDEVAQTVDPGSLQGWHASNLLIRGDVGVRIWSGHEGVDCVQTANANHAALPSPNTRTKCKPLTLRNGSRLEPDNDMITTGGHELVCVAHITPLHIFDVSDRRKMRILVGLSPVSPMVRFI